MIWRFCMQPSRTSDAVCIMHAYDYSQTSSMNQSMNALLLSLVLSGKSIREQARKAHPL
jgi:hypothetical protein